MTATPRVRARAIAFPRVDVRLLVGIVLVVAALLGGLAFTRAAGQTTALLVAAREIAPGELITAADLEVTRARLEGTLATLAIPEAERAAVAGRPASGRIHAGELLLRPHLGDGPALGPDEVAITVPVKADTVYPQLRRGDAVSLLATSERGKPASRTVTVLERTSVYAVAAESTRVRLGSDGTAGEGQDGRLSNVTLVVPRAEAERVTYALINADLTVVLLPAARATMGGAP